MDRLYRSNSVDFRMICGSREKSMCMHHPPICQSVCLSVSLSVCLFIYLSHHLSNYLVSSPDLIRRVYRFQYLRWGWFWVWDRDYYLPYIYKHAYFPFYKNRDPVPPRKPAQRTNSHCTRRSNVAVSVPLSFSAVHEYMPESVCLKLLDQRSS